MQAGDRAEAIYKGNKYIGIIMPSTEKGLTILKLDNGYNIGLKGAELKKLGEAAAAKVPTFKSKSSKLPTISLITTGGTITSRVDYRTGAVYPLSKPEELLAQIPELSKLVNIKILNPFSIFSEDMTSAEWVKLAKLTSQELNKPEVKGVIITHGTDTLHFTSAALSFMLKNLNKPVALVGGQRSSDRGSFDGAQNLICAAHYCLSDIAEVAVVMHGTTEDDYCNILRGTKVRKMSTSRRDAFRPINDLPIAQVWPDGKIKPIEKYNKRSKSKVILDAGFEPKIALIKFTPGMNAEIIDFFVKQKYKGLIIEGTGLGHVSTEGKTAWLSSINKAVKAGVFVGIAPQTLYGRLDPYVYTAARKMLDAGCVFLEDILPETAYIKLGIALAREKTIDKVKKTMLTNIAGEISKNISKKSYLY